MCDYSLHGVVSRPAKLGDRLITTRFPGCLTRGFSSAGEPDIAVCLKPGTELAFEDKVIPDLLPIQAAYYALARLFGFEKSVRPITPHRLGRFRQIDMNNPHTHHDAIEFADGRIVLLTRLQAGQVARILQLPLEPDSRFSTSSEETPKVASVPV